MKAFCTSNQENGVFLAHCTDWGTDLEENQMCTQHVFLTTQVDFQIYVEVELIVMFQIRQWLRILTTN